MFELERTGNPLAVQTMRHELTKLNRIRRGLVRETPALAQTFLASRSAETDLMQKQQRMINDLNESEATKRRTNTALVALQNKVRTAKKSLNKLTALAEEANTTKRVINCRVLRQRPA